MTRVLRQSLTRFPNKLSVPVNITQRIADRNCSERTFKGFDEIKFRFDHPLAFLVDKSLFKFAPDFYCRRTKSANKRFDCFETTRDFDSSRLVDESEVAIP